MADQLGRIQRVPGGLIAQPGGNRRGHRGRVDREQRSRQVGQLVVVEASQADAAPGTAFEVGEHSPQLTRAPFVGVASAEDQQHRHIDQSTAQVTEQLHRGRLGPVNVVEQNHERADRGQSRQHIADRLEQQVPVGGFVADRSAGKFDAVGQAWRDADQVPSAAAGVCPEHVRRRVLD